MIEPKQLAGDIRGQGLDPGQGRLILCRSKSPFNQQTSQYFGSGTCPDHGVILAASDDERAVWMVPSRKLSTDLPHGSRRNRSIRIPSHSADAISRLTLGPTLVLYHRSESRSWVQVPPRYERKPPLRRRFSPFWGRRGGAFGLICCHPVGTLTCRTQLCLAQRHGARLHKHSGKMLTHRASTRRGVSWSSSGVRPPEWSSGLPGRR